jgi:hypothetical protein
MVIPVMVPVPPLHVAPVQTNDEPAAGCADHVQLTELLITLFWPPAQVFVNAVITPAAPAGPVPTPKRG